MLSYEGFQKELKKKGLTKTALGRELGISSRTLAKISRNEKVSDRVLKRMAEYFGCRQEDLCRTVSENILLQTLREEKQAGISGGLYHELQVCMTYNSNHMEGSRLSEDQTRMIFETRTLEGGDGTSVDDIIETVNHFRALDLCIDRAEEPLSEALIKDLHKILKRGTRDSELSWFAVGEYKKRPNAVGGRETADPSQVHPRMQSLIRRYEFRESVGFGEILRFHHEFECIHPFQDGSGRVGRLIAFKECLRHDLVPFIIEDTKKMLYYRGLAEYERRPGYLTDTCLDGQDTFRVMMEKAGIPAATEDGSDR